MDAHAAEQQQIELAELLAAISLATDLGRGFPQEKALRTCLVAVRIAEELGLDERARGDLFYAGLVHPVGCTGFTYEAARLFGTSEFTGVPAFAPVDVAHPVEGLRAMRESLRGEAPRRRVSAVLRNVTGGNRFRAYALRADCEAGAHFTRRFGLGDDVVRIVLQVHERWDGRGVPATAAGDKIEPGARVIALANQAEILHRVLGREEMLATVRRRAGGWFDPAAVEALERCAAAVFAELEAGSVWDAVLEAEPAPRTTAPVWRLDDVAAAIAGFVDVKSPFLLGHSSGVAHLAEEASALLGFDADGRTALRRAGLVHDVGRVAVSNLVWDKPGPLTSPEWEQVRLHAYHTERILARSPVLGAFAGVAGMHHERADGSGYHRGATAATIPPAARVLAAADVFQALTEPRPHREALTREQAAKEVEGMVATGALAAGAATAVCETAGVALRRGRSSAAWPAALTDREVEVLRLLARGLSKKQVAAALVIAPGTVPHPHGPHLREARRLDARRRRAVRDGARPPRGLIARRPEIHRTVDGSPGAAGLAWSNPGPPSEGGMQMSTRTRDGAGQSTATGVVSRDGTRIAYWTSGNGPPLVLVHGTTADHTRWRPLLPHLEPHVTVVALDRRGRGASGDRARYEVVREFEDVAAVVDAVAEASGSAVALLGHSFGGFCALGASASTANVRALVLYEPALGEAASDLPAGVVERIEAVLAAGDREGALELMMREVVRMPESEIGLLRTQPSWRARVAAAHTIPRELRAITPRVLEATRPETLDVPVLLLAGGDSPAYFRRDIETVAAAMPEARVAVIEGQQHVADVLAPATFAEHVLAFLREHR